MKNKAYRFFREGAIQVLFFHTNGQTSVMDRDGFIRRYDMQGERVAAGEGLALTRVVDVQPVYTNWIPDQDGWDEYVQDFD